jgi:hypothetical protein
MEEDSERTRREEEKQPSFGIGSLVFAAVLTLLFFWLAATMVRHHFFKSGHPHRAVSGEVGRVVQG